MGDEGKNLKSVVGSFIKSYVQRNKETDFAVWLENQLRQEMPELPEGSEQKLVQDIMDAVTDYDRALAELDKAIDAGMSKEEWFAEQIVESCAGMEYDAVGEKLLQIKQALTVSDVQLMQDIDGVQQYEAEEADMSPIEWNQYSIKQELYEMGKKSSLMGLAASASAVRCREEADGEVVIEEAVQEAFQEDMASSPQEVKAVVAGAMKVAAEKRLEESLPYGTTIGDISDMAGAAVESAEALFGAASGEIGTVEALDRIGRAGVVSACRIGKRALHCALVSIPVAGPLLANLCERLLNHMENQGFYEHVYTAVRDTAVSAWEGIKNFGRKAVQKAASFTAWLFG